MPPGDHATAKASSGEGTDSAGPRIEPGPMTTPVPGATAIQRPSREKSASVPDGARFSRRTGEPPGPYAKTALACPSQKGPPASSPHTAQAA